MDTKKIFEILEIAETKNETLIKEAYRSKLVTVNPEDNPEGFKRLREAYETALRFAALQEEPLMEKADDPVSLYLERLNGVYRSLSRRLDTEEWKALLKDELLDDLDLGEDAKWQLFRFLASNYKVPTEIWRLLDQTFHIREEAQKFKEHLPVNFVDFILWSCTEEAALSEFPLHQLTGSDTADYDEFLLKLDELSSLAGRQREYEDNALWLKEQAQKIAYLETLGISHPYYELEKARYAMEDDRSEDALQAADALLGPGTEDARLLLGCARIYKRCGREADAEQIYRDFLESDTPKDADQTEEAVKDQNQAGAAVKEQTQTEETAKSKRNHSPANIYTSAMALADILMNRKEYTQAREYAIQAMDSYHTEEAIQLLTNSSNAIIEQLTGEQAPAEDLSIEDGILLADCYLDTNRAAEGVAYFDEHPVLTEDSTKCHRMKALLLNAGERYEEALTETLQWRKCLDTDPEAKPSLFVRSLVLEARVREQLYKAHQDKQSQEAKSQKEAAFAAFEEAFRLMPDETECQINARINKVMFLRALWEDEPSRDYYQEAAALCEEIKELDNSDYWAYHYAQEAYEKLGNAQKVVDNFYDAKRIYAGMPEIYERAARVFQNYEQWNDLGHILKQAEEAGVTSDILKIMKMELVRVEAKSKQEVWQAEVYCKRTIAELEEKLEKETSERETQTANALPEDELKQLKRALSEAYRQRALLHDDNGKIKGFKKLDDIENWLLRSVELWDMFSNRYFLGYLYMYEKVNYQEAYKHLKVCEEMGSSHWVFFRIALCHEEWEQWDDAIEYYKKGTTLAPDHDDYLWRIAWLYRQKFIRTEQMEYYDEAIKYLDLQMERFGEHPKDRWEIWWQYSDLHCRKGEYEQALTEIERALKTNGRGRNWGHKADLLELLGRPQEAFAAYEKGIEISRKNKSDYSYGYTHIYQYFCRHRAYEDGIAWFESKMDLLLTEDQRVKNLGRILNFHLKLENWPKAMETLERMYGGTTLKDFVCRSWKDECGRINDVLDAYQYFLSNEELHEKAQEAAALLDRFEEFKPEGEPTPKKIIHEGKREAYAQIAYCYSNYLLDDETGMFYFEKSFEHAKLAGEETENDDYRGVILDIMGCLWHLGRISETVHFRRLFLMNLAKDYEECASLGKSLEDMNIHSRNSRINVYSLFKLELFCGNYERAAELLEQMDCARWCWHCREKDCTEVWECKGYMALSRGQKEEAVRCFRQAAACVLFRNDDAECELRRLHTETER
ncbi:MAG: hypothetical protein J1E01_08080 [Acetatifactor sp.]|nr:hypothetical protein [Acetatifactor sp.]